MWDRLKHGTRNTEQGIRNVFCENTEQKCLESIELAGDYPEAILYVNYDYLNRPENIFDELIFDAQYKGYDTVFPGYLDYGHYWLKNEDDDYQQTDASMKHRSERQPAYRALYGLGCLSSAAIVRTGKIVGGKTLNPSQ